MSTVEPVLRAVDLVKHFELRSTGLLRRVVGTVKAVDGVSFDLTPGRTLGLVGESGCGKSTTARLLLNLIGATSGQVLFDGQDLQQLSQRELRPLRRHLQIVFQDPFASLNPRMTVASIIAEPMQIQGTYEQRGRARVRELLAMVGLNPEHANRYPHEFSGGQRQRIGIARALATDPKVLILDEPVSALDVSVQSQVLNLLLDLQEERGLTYLFITHDLTIAKLMSDTIVVMYLGRVVEHAPAAELFHSPHHPYTKALLSAIPIPSPEKAKDRAQQRIILQGEMPSPSDPPPGCAFQTRCPDVMDICRTVRPPLARIDGDHYVACHLHHPDPREHELPLYSVTPPAGASTPTS